MAFSFNRLGVLDSASRFEGDTPQHALIFDLGTTPMDEDEFEDVVAGLVYLREDEDGESE